MYPLRAAMHDAVSTVLGPVRFTEPLPEPGAFNPHVSIAYVSSDGQTEPIAAALRDISPRRAEVTFTKASLLEFHRDRRMYEWTSATRIAIGVAPCRETANLPSQATSPEYPSGK